MTPDVFAEWLRRQGHLVVKTESSYWYILGPRILQAFPYHWLITPEEEELDQLLRENKAIGLRYSTPVSSSRGMVSYHVVYDGKEYLQSSLSKKARYDVRKGLKNTRIRPIQLSNLASEGWPVRLETLIRQGRERAESQEWWNLLCNSASDLPGFEAWGAFADGKMAASILAFQCDNCYSILYQQSRTDYLSLGVNNALTFVVTNAVIKRPTVDYIFYGLHSLDAPASVDEYKFRMNYTARPVRQRVVVHPWLTPVFNHTSHAVLKKLRNWRSESSFLAKAEGIVRFYLEGNLPLSRQVWPDPLSARRSELLST